MANFNPGDRIVCEDGRAGVVDHKHNGIEPGPVGEFYVVVFDGKQAPEWQPTANLLLNADAGKTLWLSTKAAEADVRSVQAAKDNVQPVEIAEGVL